MALWAEWEAGINLIRPIPSFVNEQPNVALRFTRFFSDWTLAWRSSRSQA